MGFALADAAIARSHEVVLVAGPVSLDPPPQAVYVPVTSAQQMYRAVMRHWRTCNGAIACAAVADFRPTTVSSEKIKKADPSLTLELVRTVDVLAALGNDKADRWLCGFALESHDLLARARAKLVAKNLDLIVANEPSALGTPESRIVVLDCGGQVVLDSHGPKRDLARQLMALIDGRFGTPTPR